VENRGIPRANRCVSRAPCPCSPLLDSTLSVLQRESTVSALLDKTIGKIAGSQHYIDILYLLSMKSSLRAIALAFCAAFEMLDLDTLLALRTPDCRHTIAPSSLNFGRDMSNEQWAVHFSLLRGILLSFPVTPIEILENKMAQQITIWATSNATFLEAAKTGNSTIDWSFHGEYIFILFLNPEGDKIQRIIEFVDSRGVTEVALVFQQAALNVAKTKEDGA
jgi:hypothetical protein